VQAQREEAIAGGDALLRDIIRLVGKVNGYGHYSTVSLALAHIESSWKEDTADRQAVLFRLLLAMPWGSGHMQTRDRQHPMLSQMSDLFDTVDAVRSKLRPLANRWVTWAGKHTFAILQAWDNEMANLSTSSAL
jgi:hypothetical protein